MKKILIVDDEQDLCEILQFNLENEGYEVDTANSSEEALTKLLPSHELILLDVMMGGMSGYQLAKKLRSEKNNIPIVFLTAKNTENDMLTGFSIGGDDYIAKPFSIKEVVARIKAIARRMDAVKMKDADNEIDIDGLVINEKQKTVTLDGEPLLLTKKEFLILKMLVEARGEFFSREQILKHVWNDESYVLERTVDVHITRLRKKLGRLADNICSRPGFGYAWMLNNKNN